jgi:hypothetical protein
MTESKIIKVNSDEINPERKSEKYEHYICLALLETFQKEIAHLKNKDDIDTYFKQVCTDFGMEQCILEAINKTLDRFDLQIDEKKICQIANEKVNRKIKAANIYNTKIWGQPKDDKPTIQVPQNDNPINVFANEIVKHINKHTINLFYRPRLHSIVEVTNWYDKVLDQRVMGLRDVNANRLINCLENKFCFYSKVMSRYGEIKVKKSMSKTHAEILMENEIFLSALPKIDRFFTSSLPHKVKGELVIPEPGWDERLDSYLVQNAPKVELLDTKKSKEIINKLYKEFCFKEERDKVFAISHLLTPGCRGLYKTLTARTPIFLYMANRERCGKDYCAGIVSIAYEGFAFDNPPISTKDRQGNPSDELRKKLTSAMKRGVRIMHFANNKGRLDNAVLEQAITSEHWRDRELGRNTEILLNNEVDFSLSANIGLTFTGDFWHRSRRIELFYGPEDINKREFNEPDLHGFVKHNRGEILSAVYTLIKTWFDAGEPSGPTFTSFPEWARVVGGVMKYHGLGDPCSLIEDYDEIGGDVETKQMRDLWIYMYNLDKENQTSLENMRYGGVYTMSQIIDCITKAQEQGEAIFPSYNLDQRSERIKISLKLRKFIGREFAGIRFVIKDKNDRKARETYTFIKNEKNGENGKKGSFNDKKPEKVVMFGNNRQCQYTTTKNQQEYIGGYTHSQILPTLPNKDISNSTGNKSKKQKPRQKIPQITWFELYFPPNEPNLGVSKQELLNDHISEAQISEKLAKGELYECKPGILRRL